MIFSDERRGWKIAVALAAVLAMGAYYAWIAANLQSGWRWANEDPVGRDGATLVFPLWTVTSVTPPDRFEISKIIAGIPVEGDATSLKPGDTISLEARFDAQRKVAVEVDREVHTLRRWKEALSVVGFLVMAALGPFAFRLRDWRVEERTWRT